jgi:hypothetical protein
MRVCLLAFVAIAVVLPPVCAADKNDKKEPFPFQEAARKKDWEWDEDERFDELMEQLAINEASLDAVEAAVAKKTRRKTSQQSEAKRQDANTRMMDRKGGGPMKWDEFYGTNAEKFFYHPVDPNTTYRTDTFLRQMGKAEDDKSGEDTPSRQSLPVHQRPPQWDYIYRANKTARDNALADASIAESEIERLEQRRTELEKEQAVLWCKLAFRAVQRLNMARKPLLRFELISATGDGGNTDQAKALSSATRFLAASLAVVEKAEQDQSVAFGGVATVVTEARETFEDSLLEVSALESEWESTKTDLGKFYRLSQMLADKAQTLKESYAGAMDGDLNKEAARKERFRGMLQSAVVDYAQILLALDELADSMMADWQVKADTKKKISPTKVAWGSMSAGQGSGGPLMPDLNSLADASSTEQEKRSAKPLVIDQKTLKEVFGALRPTYDKKSGILTLYYDFARPEQLRDWEVPDNAVTKSTQGKGIRISPAASLRHRVSFQEGTCTFAFAIRQSADSGKVISAGDEITASQEPYYSRQWKFSRDKSVQVGKGNDILQFRVHFAVEGRRYLVRVNDAELAVDKVPSGTFSFLLHGGNNGADFGMVTISGKPEEEWLDKLLRQ